MSYRHYKSKPTRSKQPVPKTLRERLHAPVRANSHKGPIVWATKGFFELKTIPITVLCPTQRYEGCSKLPLSSPVKNYAGRDHNIWLPKNITQRSNVFLTVFVAPSMGNEPHALIIHSVRAPLLCKVERSCSLVFQWAFESQTAYQLSSFLRFERRLGHLFVRQRFELLTICFSANYLQRSELCHPSGNSSVEHSIWSYAVN